MIFFGFLLGFDVAFCVCGILNVYSLSLWAVLSVDAIDMSGKHEVDLDTNIWKVSWFVIRNSVSRLKCLECCVVCLLRCSDILEYIFGV